MSYFLLIPVISYTHNHVVSLSNYKHLYLAHAYALQHRSIKGDKVSQHFITETFSMTEQQWDS